jgi:hypothetical protein
VFGHPIRAFGSTIRPAPPARRWGLVGRRRGPVVRSETPGAGRVIQVLGPLRPTTGAPKGQTDNTATGRRVPVLIRYGTPSAWKQFRKSLGIGPGRKVASGFGDTERAASRLEKVKDDATRAERDLKQHASVSACAERLRRIERDFSRDRPIQKPRTRRHLASDAIHMRRA